MNTDLTFATGRFPQAIRLLSLITASRARTNTAQCAVALLRKATFVIHKLG